VKPINLSQFDLHHLPECDLDGRRARQEGPPIAYTRISVPVHRTPERAAPTPDRRQDDEGEQADLVRLVSMLERAHTESRGLELLHNLDDARGFVDAHAKIGVVFFVPDRASFDDINFPGQVETIGRHEGSRTKTFSKAGWQVEVTCLGYADTYDAGEDDDDEDDEDDDSLGAAH
jgi:hypothetical protein